MTDPVINPDPKIAVVIPAKDNELMIGSLVLLARQYAGTVIVADDSSKDRTAEVAEQAGATVLHNSEYGGSGRVAAILAGCRRALESGCTAVVLIDSSGRHLTREIPHLAEPVLEGKADLVIGSRNLAGRMGIPAYQFDETGKACAIPPKPAQFVATDPGSTFRALNAKAIALLDVLPESESFEEAMNGLFTKRGFAMQEIAVTLRDQAPAKDADNLPLYKGQKVAVVVPAYNEELLIGDTLKNIPDFVCRVYVINDCSKDRTQEVVEYYASHDDSIVPIRHEVNKGVGAAIVTGYKRALAEGMDIVAVMAGDDQMDPAFLPELLDPIVAKKCDYTMGNRLISPAFRKGMSKWRFIGNSTLTMLTKIASGYWQMMDPQNGYTAISARALERISLNDIYPRYGYCNDVLVRLNVVGFRVINVPHPARYGKEQSKIKYSSYILKVSWLLLTDFLWRLKMKYFIISFHPLVFFYIAGAFFSLAGVLGGLYSLHFKFIQGHPIFVPMTLSLLIFGFGIMMLFFAMFFDMQQERMTNGWYA
ncbi:MAG TPA: glycosyltransferase family 2 protein [Methanoregula sp.]|nr:glycosyltransferase family 2 protein [Methanoregula sp.]